MRWAKVTATFAQETVLELEGVGVARLIDRIDGSWFVVLDYHLNLEPRRTRDCTSFAAGKRGAELWAERHMERLRTETDQVRSRWARLPVRNAPPER